jgi:fructose-1,6-bisphosphatase/inositol monophosphatase family enzyme
VAGVPQYTVLVALEHENDGVVGVVHNPALHRMMVASKGNGCRLNGKPVHVGMVSELSRASILASDYTGLFKTLGPRAGELLQACRFAPGWGDAYGYSLVAEGKCDIMLDAGLKIWDAGPLKVCLEEAGGKFTDWNGTASIHIENGIAANPILHQQVLEFLGGVS